MRHRLDLRLEAPRAQPKTRIRHGDTVMRDPKTVTGIVVHQMATRLGVSKRLLEQAGWDRRLAEGRRAARTACHGAAMRSGLSVLTRPLGSYLWHGNAFNRYSLGLEIEGLYPGLRDNLKTVRRVVRHRVDPVTDELVLAARSTLTWMVEEGRAEGMPIRFIWAHRQSSPTRRSDPGEELWQRVVLDYAVPVLGLETQNEVKLESKSKKSRGWGNRIPQEWDREHGVGGY